MARALLQTWRDHGPPGAPIGGGGAGHGPGEDSAMMRIVSLEPVQTYRLRTYRKAPGGCLGPGFLDVRLGTVAGLPPGLGGLVCMPVVSGLERRARGTGWCTALRAFGACLELAGWAGTIPRPRLMGLLVFPDAGENPFAANGGSGLAGEWRQFAAGFARAAVVPRPGGGAARAAPPEGTGGDGVSWWDEVFEDVPGCAGSAGALGWEALDFHWAQDADVAFVMRPA